MGRQSTHAPDSVVGDREAGDGTAGSEDVPESDVVDLLVPSEGVPPLVEDQRALRDAAERLAVGHGPVAVDAERASGYRYSARAYLVQLRRGGAGSFLIDPIACDGDLSVVGTALRGVEWVLHAASQDLACLAEVGMAPDSLFDTELAGRLAGYPRVGLAPLAERLLGVRLQKGHGAADWSRRPLPPDWLVYAALDVELLVAMRDGLAAELAVQNKEQWAAEEFEAVRTAGPPAKRAEPWRRTSGLHKLRKPRQLAAVRALWESRDALAAARDTAPGRLLPDAAIVDAAQRDPQSRDALSSLPVFRGRAQRRLADRWWAALASARALPRTDLPETTMAYDGPPPAHRWGDKDPPAAARLVGVRAVLAELAQSTATPVENLLQPDASRRLAWSPPAEVTPATVDAALTALGARPWQRALVSAGLADALVRARTDEAGQTAREDPAQVDGVGT